MKQPIAARIIEFPSKLTMANTCIFAVAFLASLSLSSAFVQQDFDISKDFQKNLDLELQPFLREKREEDVYLVKKHDPLELEELSESQTVHDRRAIVEETKKLNLKDDGKNEEPRTSNDVEEDVKDDVFSYRSMHDLIQAFILADEQDIAMRLQQLREIENATASEKLSNLPKRHASAAAAAAAASNLLGANLWDAIPVTDLDAHSCEVEAFEYGHVHSSGLVVHEFFCELRKLWHYFLIIVRNLRAGLTLGPLIAEEVVVEGHGILHFLLRIPRLLFTLIRAPHHLLILPDIIRDAVPFHSVHHALRRLVHVVLKVLHFVRELLWGNIRYVLGHFFHLHHLGLNLRDRLLQLRLTRLHYLHGLGSVLPCENVVGGPVAATATSAAAAAAATATATATATAADDGAIIAPDYHSSLAEVLSSFRGIYDGYHASGIPHLIRTGVASISTSTVYSKVTSYLSNVPTYWTNIYSHLSNLPSLINNYAPQSTTVTATSAASASSSVDGSVASPIVSPVVGPLIRPASSLVPLASIAPVESVSSSASASASASVTETQPLVSAPLISAVPTVVSPVVSSSDAASAAATAAATAAAAAASASAASVSPVVSSYQTAVPCAPLVSETIENTVSESSSSSVAVASPEVVVPDLSAGNAAAAASAAASVSSASDIDSAYRPRPVLGSLSGYSPILSSVSAPASAASASSSASVSSDGNLIDQYRGLDWNLGGRLPRIRQRIRPVILPAVAPSSAAAAAAATAAASSASGGAAAASSASTLSSGGLNFLLPREHIIGAIGHDYLLPGDLVSVTLKNKAILVGRVLDATSPISFSFLRPKLRAALFRHGGRIWNLSPWDFRDPECIRKFNSPALLRYAL